jgi:hypothetical protein
MHSTGSFTWARLALLGALLSAAGCSENHANDASPGAVAAAVPGTTACGSSCIYRQRSIMDCDDGLYGPNYTYGYWDSNCLGMTCDQAADAGAFDPNYFGADDLAPCQSWTVHNAMQPYAGSCTGWYAAGSPLTTEAGAPQPDGTACNGDGDCASRNCMSMDGQTFSCASACAGGDTCPAGFTCAGGYCFPSCGG